jgi:hypothetical protein
LIRKEGKARQTFNSSTFTRSETVFALEDEEDEEEDGGGGGTSSAEGVFSFVVNACRMKRSKIKGLNTSFLS